MKYFSILFIAAILVATSCSKSAQDLLVGTWKANSVKLNTKGSTKQDTIIDVSAFLLVSPSSITYNTCASTCTGSSTIIGQTSNFTYVLSSDGKSIAITDSLTKYNITVNELTSSSLKLNLPIPSGLPYVGTVDVGLSK